MLSKAAGTSLGTSGYSFFATGKIAATEFNTFSDERIKTIQGVLDNSKESEKLKKI